MATNEERREVARKLRETSDDITDWGDSNPYWYIMKCVYGDVQIHDDNEFFYLLSSLIEPEPERTCKWVWGEEWLESSPASPRELQWANWYLDCGCWDGDEDEFEDLDNPDEMPKGHWMYCHRCGAKVVDE